MSILKIKHNAGFFSCCSIRLIDIIHYFNENKTLPDEVDSSEQFSLYKLDQNDITSLFFKENNSNIEYNSDVILTLESISILPFVKKTHHPPFN